MADAVEEKGVSLEVLGTCMTNTIPNSQHKATVEYWHLWSYAQEAALVAVCDKDPASQCYKLIEDPERRAKRIAGHYADLYFKSAKKSQGEVQFYWPALAAFVVKDIVEAYRFSREEVLQNEWRDSASVVRNSSLSELGSMVMTSDSPYQHVVRTYAALAKGNLWLFMDIYPWLWFFMEYGINPDGSLNTQRINSGPAKRDWSNFQKQSKAMVEELPYGPNWLGRLSSRIANDPVYKEANDYFDYFSHQVQWSQDGGYGAFAATAFKAHSVVRKSVKTYDEGYRVPPSNYWGKFKEAFFVLVSERIELKRVAADSAGTDKLLKIRNFKVTPEIQSVYRLLVAGHSAKDNKFSLQQEELQEIAKQEQINVLQPLIYEDTKLTETMDLNHKFSRLTGGWLSPQYKVVFSASPKTNDPNKEVIFDAPKGAWDRVTGIKKSLPNQADRMGFVGEIADVFNGLMKTKRPYMEAELRKIQAWVNA